MNLMMKKKLMKATPMTIMIMILKCKNILHNQKLEKRKDEVLLDSGSTISIFKDDYLVKNIRPEKQKLMVYMNAREKIINREADIPVYGSVYFYNKAITNLFA